MDSPSQAIPTFPRSTSPLNSKLDKKIAAYMAVAAAAGVSLLAAQLAEARVVYTPTNVVLTSSIPIDLNNDGVVDFALNEFDPYGLHERFLVASPQVTGNAVRLNGSAACGFFGVPVGPGEKFGTTSYFGHGVFMAGFFQYSHSSSFGAWTNVTNRYLGFKFLINGQTHYGWARVTVTNQLLNVALTGYAYETIPNKNIIEGHTSGAERAIDVTPSEILAPAAQPVTLGMLARGADGLSIWRREDESAIN
jgi:hypothetical protein